MALIAEAIDPTRFLAVGAIDPDPVEPDNITEPTLTFGGVPSGGDAAGKTFAELSFGASTGQPETRPLWNLTDTLLSFGRPAQVDRPSPAMPGAAIAATPGGIVSAQTDGRTGWLSALGDIAGSVLDRLGAQSDQVVPVAYQPAERGGIGTVALIIGAGALAYFAMKG